MAKLAGIHRSSLACNCSCLLLRQIVNNILSVMIDFNPEIPEKCLNCAVQSGLCDTFRELNLLKMLFNITGENLTGESGEEFDALVDAAMPEELGEEIKTRLRSGLSKELDTVDAEMATVAQELGANALACSGTLNMRASKDDITYTVYACTSARVNLLNAPEPHPIPMNVSAQTRVSNKQP